MYPKKKEDESEPTFIPIVNFKKKKCRDNAFLPQPFFCGNIHVSIKKNGL